MLEKEKLLELGYEQVDLEDKYRRELYIVMELLQPTISNNIIISPKGQQKKALLQDEIGHAPSSLEQTQITNELGVYGVLVK